MFYIVSGQHVVLVCVEIVIVLTVISYCRRNGDFDDEEFDNENEIDIESSVNSNRRKTIDVSLSSKNRITTKKRRPSEIASNIVSSGSNYCELLINDNNDDKKEKATTISSVNFNKKGDKKRNKRKRSNDQVVTVSNSRSVKSFHRDDISSDIPGGTNLPSRRASSSDAIKYFQQKKQSEINCRPVSAPETSDGWFSDQKMSNNNNDDNENGDLKLKERLDEEILEPRYQGIEEMDNRNLSLKPVKTSIVSSGGILKNKRISSPGFMKTALVSRSKRIIGGVNEYPGGATLKSDNWEWYSRNTLSKSSQEEVIKESPSRQAVTLARVTIATNNQGFNGYSCSSINGRQDESDDSGSRSATPSSSSNSNTKQEKKIYGIKKMVKKLF